jgi:hypothetical protein
MNIEPEITRLCRACNKEKKLSQFHKQNAADGYTARCKMCQNSGILIPKHKIIKNEIIPLTLTGLKEGDYVDMYKFLNAVGYSLNDENDIHEQFCIKYGLKPSNPKQTFNYHFTPKDLGLI